MRIIKSIFITLILIAGLCAQSMIQGPQESREVVAKGLGAILAGDEVKAKEAFRASLIGLFAVD